MSTKFDVSHCTFSLQQPTVVWSVTNYCPLQCSHCFRQSGRHERLESVSEDELQAALTCVRRVRGARLVVSGGEPLAVPNIVWVLQRLNDAKVDYSLCSSVAAVGVERMRAVVSAGLQRITVGIDLFHSGESIEGYVSRMLRRVNLLHGVPTKGNVCVGPNVSPEKLVRLVPLLKKMNRLTVSAVIRRDPSEDGWTEDRARVHEAAELLVRNLEVPVSIRLPRCHATECPSSRLVFGIGGGVEALLGCPDSRSRLEPLTDFGG